jgi:DNA-binding response OmpR family regulator
VEKNGDCILIVDDNSSNLRLLRSILVENNYLVRVATNGTMALTSALDEPPDLILLDIMMPDMDGYEVCKRLKADKQTKDIPVLFISAMREVADKVKSFQAGGVDYITKPFQSEEVLARVNSHLTLSRLRKQLQHMNESLEQQVQERTSSLSQANSKLRAEIDRRMTSEEALRHAQKMEAIGKLAGGVAHDFNNLLQVILGGLGLVMMDIPPNSPIRQELSEVLTAAERATTLVRQLLVFSRRQVLELTDLDINHVVIDLSKMIRRFIGETINLEINTCRDPTTVRADSGQIEQVLMNLCINARDAMPRGGKISIDTDNQAFDEERCRVDSWAKPGRYVVLRVTDTGMGMDQETVEHIFEPFFTTKEAGEGTGLGLSTVYGIVQQHDGFITVKSTPHQGTTFKIYLPVVDRVAASIEEPKADAAPGGVETVLLAEDDLGVRVLGERILKKAGYQVLTATDGIEALSLFEEHGDKIDLALLDVVMPKLGGPAVIEKIRSKHPELPVLFTSGYMSTPMLPELGAVHLIQKPFNTKQLLEKVRELLDGQSVVQ